MSAACKEIISAGMRPVMRCRSDGSIEVEALPMDSAPLPALDAGSRKAGNLIEGAFGGKQANGYGAD
ncbi:hypothetical protein D1227_06185 [Henriciella mobilis]|nr:hypothetical protein D1227_12955 [Henriciella mobilis]RIJ23089.1 hypothetical protein D1227_06185 [Henriciella mobilis]